MALRTLALVLILALVGCAPASSPKPPQRGCPFSAAQSRYQEKKVEHDLDEALQQLEASVRTLEALNVISDEVLGLPISVELGYRLQEAQQQAIELRLLIHEVKTQQH